METKGLFIEDAEEYAKNFRTKVEKILEDYVQDLVRNYDLRAVQRISESLDDIEGQLSDYMEDLRMHLAEKRAQVMTHILEKIPAIHDMQWEDDGTFTMIVGMEFDPQKLDEIWEHVKKICPDLIFENIMTKPFVVITSPECIRWKWVD